MKNGNIQLVYKLYGTISWEENNCFRAQQIHKMTNIFIQNENFWPLSTITVTVIVILWICSGFSAVIFFSTWDNLHGSSANSSELEPGLHLNSCYVIYAILIPSSINSRYRVDILVFSSQGTKCWPKTGPNQMAWPLYWKDYCLNIWSGPRYYLVCL